MRVESKEGARPMNEEKRRARRFGLNLPVMVSGAGMKESQREVQTRDISSNGIFLDFDEDLSPGSRMEVEITLPAEITQAGPVRVRCCGQVVRVYRGNRMGVAVTIDKYEFLRQQERSARSGFLN